MSPRFDTPIPILRSFDEARARDFYLDWLGFELDWEHRFAPDLPLYLQIRRGRLVLHLSEHHGDGTPGTVLYLPVFDIDAFAAELAGRSCRYARPTVEPAPWGALVMEIADPFGNRLRFAEPAESAESDGP